MRPSLRKRSGRRVKAETHLALCVFRKKWNQCFHSVLCTLSNFRWRALCHGRKIKTGLIFCIWCSVSGISCVAVWAIYHAKCAQHKIRKRWRTPLDVIRPLLFRQQEADNTRCSSCNLVRSHQESYLLNFRMKTQQQLEQIVFAQPNFSGTKMWMS